jgi:cyclopropane fatty-acyl-phospholipid synthase-like methyltransferase
MIREVHRNTRLTYNKIADKYHELFRNELDEKPFDKDYLDKFSNYFHRNSKIVDAGCGPTAHIGRYLFDKGLNVLGIDISERCIQIASEYNPQMEFICIDILDWKPAKNSIDGIISFYSIIYTPKSEIDQLFQIFQSALVPGGKLLMVVKKGDFEGYQKEVLGIKVHSYFAEYQEREIEQIVIRNGFRIEELITRTPYDGEIKNERIYCLCSKLDI